MQKKDIDAFYDIGQSAAKLYAGAFEILKNSKQAERIVFLFFSAQVYGKDETMQFLFNNFEIGGKE